MRRSTFPHSLLGNIRGTDPTPLYMPMSADLSIICHMNFDVFDEGLILSLLLDLSILTGYPSGE